MVIFRENKTSIAIENKKKDLVVGGHEVFDNTVEGLVAGFAQVSILGNLKKNNHNHQCHKHSSPMSYLIQKWPLGAANVIGEFLLEVGDLAGVDLVQEASDAAVDDGNLVLDGHGHVLALLEELGQPDTTIQELLGGSIQIRTELSESGDLTVLGELELHGTGDLMENKGQQRPNILW